MGESERLILYDATALMLTVIVPVILGIFGHCVVVSVH